jgi:RNA polymerase sigma-70 factor (ECF subfamily)
VLSRCQPTLRTRQGDTTVPSPATTAIELHQLVAHAQAGDREAFGEIYAQLSPQIYGYFHHHIGTGRLDDQRAIAEDLTAGLFLKVIEKLHRYQDQGVPFTSWVYRLAHNHLIDYFRTQPKMGYVLLDDGDHLVAPGAEDALGEALTRHEITRALNALTAEQRSVVTLRFLQGLNIVETAARVGRSEDAVKKLQARGLAALRRALTWQGTTRAELAA